MKQLLILAVIAMLVLSACSEKDNKPTDVNIYGYSLDQFIDRSQLTTIVDSTAPDSADFRPLFAYEIVSGVDGFSPRNSSYAGYDLNWSSFKAGYIVPSDGNRTYFADPNLPGAFKVRDTGLFRLYRKIDVYTGSRAKTMVELGGLTIYQITNWDNETENAIKLSDLVQGIASYDSIRIVCYDGYGEDKYYHQDAIDDGYYLLDTERTIFPTASLPNNQKKMKKVAFIDVIGAVVSVPHDFALTPNTAADLVVNVPTDFSSYVQTALENYGGK